ncbi:MAG: hypothetical protein GXP27_07540 [Planctomycetes bacterium]|nr:hypothetical protein [Planctomycetota bacterium]
MSIPIPSLVSSGLVLIVFVSCVLSGCKSLHSRLLYRDETNSCWVQSKLRGVPITLKVPTHLKVEIVEKTLLTTDGSGKAQPVSLPAGTTLRDVRTDLIFTEKIFTVDLERPAAGLLKYTAEFEGQYFKKLQSELEDVTIEETSEAIERILGGIAPQGLVGVPTAARPTGKEPLVKEIDSVVAAAVFELDAPDFEVKLEEFLNAYLNTRALSDGPKPATPPATTAVGDD